MELVVLPIILIPIFIALAASTKLYPWQTQDQNYDVLSQVLWSDGGPRETKAKEHLYKLAGNTWNDADGDYDYYWSFQPESKNYDTLDFHSKEKKQDHETRFCMNVPGKKKYNEEFGFDFRPAALREYECEDIPPAAINNWNHLPVNSTVCGVRGECLTHEREIMVFKKKISANRNEANCWQKLNHNLSIGCLCLNHFFHDYFV